MSKTRQYLLIWDIFYQAFILKSQWFKTRKQFGIPRKGGKKETKSCDNKF